MVQCTDVYCTLQQNHRGLRVMRLSGNSPMQNKEKNESDETDKHIDGLIELMNFVRTVQIGFEHTENLVSITDSLHTIRRFRDKEIDLNFAEKIEDAKKLEKFAKTQAEANHPYLYNLALVKAWSILESCVDEVALSRIRKSKFGDFSKFQAIKVPIYEFINLGNEEQSEIILEKFKEAQSSQLKKAVAGLNLCWIPLE